MTREEDHYRELGELAKHFELHTSGWQQLVPYLVELSGSELVQKSLLSGTSQFQMTGAEKLRSNSFEVEGHYCQLFNQS